MIVAMGPFESVGRKFEVCPVIGMLLRERLR